MSSLAPEHHAAARAVVTILAATLPALKSVDDVVRGYVDDITRNMLDVLDGNMTRGDAARAHKSYLRRDAEPAYLEGMRAGGIENPGAEITPEEQAEIKAWVADQAGYVSDFWAAVAEAAKLKPAFGTGTAREDLLAQYNAARRALSDRITLWESALRELAGRGKAAAMTNTMCRWKLGATEEHCSTCARLNGQRHRLSWFTDRGYIPQQNDSETLDCGGWRCLCSIVDDKGRQILPA